MEKRIYAKWLAYELRKQGFQIIRTEVNEHYPQFDVFVFKFTPELDEALDKLARK